MSKSPPTPRSTRILALGMVVCLTGGCDPEEVFRPPAATGERQAEDVTVTPSTLTLSQGSSGVVSVSAGDPYDASVGPLPYGVLVGVSSGEYPELDSVEVRATATATPGTHPVVFRVNGYSTDPGYDTLTLTVERVAVFDFDWTFCPGVEVLWFATRDGAAGPWSTAAASGGGVSFSLSERRVMLAIVVEVDGVDELRVFHTTLDALLEPDLPRYGLCPGGSRSVTVDLAGVDSASARVALGDYVPSAQSSAEARFDVPTVLGPIDLVASRTPDGARLPDRLVVIPQVDPGDPFGLTVDFEGPGSFPLDSIETGLYDLLPGDEAVVDTRIVTDHGALTVMDGAPWSTGRRTLPAVPQDIGSSARRIFQVRVTRAGDPIFLFSLNGPRYSLDALDLREYIDLENSRPSVFARENGGVLHPSVVIPIFGTPSGRWATVEFSQGALRARILTTPAYQRDPALPPATPRDVDGDQTLELGVPDLRALPGWSSDWDFAPGLEVDWDVRVGSLEHREVRSGRVFTGTIPPP